MFHQYNQLKSIQVPIIELWLHIFTEIDDFWSISGPEWRSTGPVKILNGWKSLEMFVYIMFHQYNRLKSIQIHIINLGPHIFMKIGDFRFILVYFGPEMEVHSSQEESKWMEIFRNVLIHVCTTIIID